VVVLEDSIWMFGGMDDQTTLNDLWRFGPKEKRWVQVVTSNPPGVS